MHFFRTLPSFNSNHLLQDKLLIKALLLRLVRFGAVIVTDCEPSPSLSSTREFVECIIAPPMRTLWSSPDNTTPSIKNMWTVETIEGEKKKDDAYSRKMLLPHTDGLYMPVVPGLQVFLVVKADPVEGCGQTILTDSNDVLKRLTVDSRAILSNLSLRYQCTESRETQQTCQVISMTKNVNESGKEDVNELLLYNRYDLCDRYLLSDREMAELLKLEGLIDHCSWKVQLKEGSMLIINNQRLMHGRTALSDRSKRLLFGCYIEKADWTSRLISFLSSSPSSR